MLKNDRQDVPLSGHERLQPDPSDSFHSPLHTVRHRLADPVLTVPCHTALPRGTGGEQIILHAAASAIKQINLQVADISKVVGNTGGIKPLVAIG